MNRIKSLRQKKGLSQQELAKLLFVNQTAVSQWERGVTNPSTDTAIALASLFDVSVDYLLGRNVDVPRRIKRTVPVLGAIPAGVPMEAIEDILDYEDLSPEEANDSHEYFGLRIRGRSMMPEYLDGDTIIVRRQDTAETGDDAVVMVNGDDATFKRIQRSLSGVTLVPLNTAEFTPAFYTNAEIESLPVRILGVCVELRRKKKRTSSRFAKRGDLASRSSRKS